MKFDSDLFLRFISFHNLKSKKKQFNEQEIVKILDRYFENRNIYNVGNEWVKKKYVLIYKAYKGLSC